jgi:hypothetical protein
MVIAFLALWVRADETFMLSADNQAHFFAWPDGGADVPLLFNHTPHLITISDQNRCGFSVKALHEKGIGLIEAVYAEPSGEKAQWWGFSLQRPGPKGVALPTDGTVYVTQWPEEGAIWFENGRLFSDAPKGSRFRIGWTEGSDFRAYQGVVTRFGPVLLPVFIESFSGGSVDVKLPEGPKWAVMLAPDRGSVRLQGEQLTYRAPADRRGESLLVLTPDGTTPINLPIRILPRLSQVQAHEGVLYRQARGVEHYEDAPSEGVRRRVTLDRLGRLRIELREDGALRYGVETPPKSRVRFDEAGGFLIESRGWTVKLDAAAIALEGAVRLKSDRALRVQIHENGVQAGDENLSLWMDDRGLFGMQRQTRRFLPHLPPGGRLSIDREGISGVFERDPQWLLPFGWVAASRSQGVMRLYDFDRAYFFAPEGGELLVSIDGKTHQGQWLKAQDQNWSVEAGYSTHFASGFGLLAEQNRSAIIQLREVQKPLIHAPVYQSALPDYLQSLHALHPGRVYDVQSAQEANLSLSLVPHAPIWPRKAAQEVAVPLEEGGRLQLPAACALYEKGSVVRYYRPGGHYTLRCEEEIEQEGSDGAL